MFLALQQNQEAAEQAQKAAEGCLACGAISFAIVGGWILLNIALMIWVARDARARGMDSSILWMLFVFFFGVIGLLVYLFARPQGDLIQCAKCRGKRLRVSATCPQCGNS